MRRAIPVIAATAGGLALLANFKTSPGATSVHTASALAPPSTTSSIDEPTTAAPDATTSTSTTAVATSTTARPTTTSTTMAATTQHRIDGPVVPNRYGDVQVEIVVTGHHLDDVEALQLPNDRERSAEISDYAGPRLREEALQAQSANIDMISGATYTSDSYIQSLQRAIDAIR